MLKTIKDYLNNFPNMQIENPGCPFLPYSSLSDNRSFVFDGDFQNKLTNYIYTKHGRKLIAESILEDVAEYSEKEIEELTVEDVYTYIQFICQNVYEANLYKYNTLEATTHLDYNPIENYNRIDEFHNVDTYGGQTSKTVEGGQSVENTYGAINTRDEFGEIVTDTTKGEQDNTFGKQKEENVFGKEVETIEHGQIDKNTNTRDEIGNKTDSITHGAVTETNTYGDKEITVGRVQTENTYGEKDITVGAIRTTDDFGNKVESTSEGAIHTEMQECKSTGVSAFDDASDFGSAGISQSSGNYVVGNEGDGAYNPKERQHLDHAENTDEHTNTKTINPYQDVHNTSSQQNVEAEHTDTNIVGEHTNTEKGHTDTKGTNSYVDTTSVGGHTEFHNVTDHTNQEDDKTTKDAHNVTVNKDSYTNTEGVRNDTEKVKNHTDFHTQSDHTDSVNLSGKETSNIVGEKRDRHLIDGRSHGNIGVTTTQKLIREEREIALFSIFEIISRDLITQIACTVY